MKGINGGTLIKRVTTPDQGEQYPVFDANKHKDRMAYIENDHHGEYCIDWIIIKRKEDGVEMERYNCKFVQSITWEE